MTADNKEITIKLTYVESCYLRVAVEEFADMLKKSEGVEQAKPYIEIYEFVNQQVLSQLD